jgi:hypothetical protein
VGFSPLSGGIAVATNVTFAISSSLGHIFVQETPDGVCGVSVVDRCLCVPIQKIVQEFV